MNGLYIRGDNTATKAQESGVLISKELYPNEGVQSSAVRVKARYATG